MQSKVIFIVEDDNAILDVLRDLLEDEMECQVSTSLSGETALNMLHKTTPDLFVLDYRLPGMNGIKLIERIRSIKIFNHTPIILMSACLSCDRVEGVQFLCKPFDLNVFLQMVGDMLLI